MAEFGALSSLGAGSNGVLNYGVIDKLKKADEEIMIKPLEKKLDLNKKRETALSQFITIASTVKTDTLDLADGNLFAKVSTNVSGSSVNVEANDGVKPQKFDVDVEQLAKNDVFESTGFDNSDSVINNTGGDVDLSIGVGDTSTTITLHSGASLSDLRDAINNAGIGITASIIDTGGDKPYKLILKANDTGKDNTIKFDYGKIDDLGMNQTVYESKSYDADTDKVNDSGATQTFKMTINGTDYSMDVADGTTVKDFVDAINNGDLKDSDGNALEGVSAKYEDGHIKIHLQQIGDVSIDDTNLTTDMNSNTDFTNSNRLQTAQDAKFKYDGVEITRSKNKVDDLITGVTINLTNTGLSHVSIDRNTDDIVKSIKQFVADYNSMISNIQSLTDFNKDSGNVGLFQGDSTFGRMTQDLNNNIFSTLVTTTAEEKDPNGQTYHHDVTLMATDMGFSLNRTGMISFDESKFKKMLENDPDHVQRFFETSFTKMKDSLERVATGQHSELSYLNQELKRNEKDYTKREEALKKYLDSKYNVMAEQFASYDNIIGRFNAQASSLNMQIQQAINSK